MSITQELGNKVYFYCMVEGCYVEGLLLECIFDDKSLIISTKFDAQFRYKIRYKGNDKWYSYNYIITKIELRKLKIKEILNVKNTLDNR